MNGYPWYDNVQVKQEYKYEDCLSLPSPLPRVLLGVQAHAQGLSKFRA